MEVILKEAKFELAFWEENMPSPVPSLCTKKGWVVGQASGSVLYCGLCLNFYSRA